MGILGLKSLERRCPTLSQKKEHKPCNKAQQSQSQKQSRSGKQISGESSLLGNAGNSNNGGQAGT